MATIQKDRILSFRGDTLVDSNGDKIGSIEEIYLDAETREPEWALVHTGLFGTKRSFVPLRDASEAQAGGLQVPFEKDTVKDSPGVEPNGQLSQREESELYRHYGMEYSELHSDTGLGESAGGTDAGARFERDREDAPGTVGRDTSGPTTDDAMTRSEEELHVGTERVETGRARLRKYVVTEQVTRTVPVQREEIRVEREPITDANRGDALSGGDITEEEHEVVLNEERVVVDKETVPVERVRAEKDTVTEHEQVDETVRKEQIEVDESGTGTRSDRDNI